MSLALRMGVTHMEKSQVTGFWHPLTKVLKPDKHPENLLWYHCFDNQPSKIWGRSERMELDPAHTT